MPKKFKEDSQDLEDVTTLKTLKTFIKSVEEKYGKKKAGKLRVEFHYPKEISNTEVIMMPSTLRFMGVAQYKADKRNKEPAERVVVLK